MLVEAAVVPHQPPPVRAHEAAVRTGEGSRVRQSLRQPLAEVRAEVVHLLPPGDLERAERAREGLLELAVVRRRGGERRPRRHRPTAQLVDDAVRVVLGGVVDEFLYDAVRDAVVEHERGAVAAGELALGTFGGELVGQILLNIVEEVAKDAVLQQFVLPFEVLRTKLAIVLPIQLVDNTDPALK